MRFLSESFKPISHHSLAESFAGSTLPDEAATKPNRFPERARLWIVALRGSASRQMLTENDSFWRYSTKFSSTARTRSTRGLSVSNGAALARVIQVISEPG